MTKEETLLFESPVSGLEDQCQFTRLADGSLAVAVSEEHAVDSYNQMFECTRHLTPDEARQLRDWMVRMFP